MLPHLYLAITLSGILSLPLERVVLEIVSANHVALLITVVLQLLLTDHGCSQQSGWSGFGLTTFLQTLNKHKIVKNQ